MEAAMRRKTIAIAAAVSTSLAAIVGIAAARDSVRPSLEASIATHTQALELDDATIVAIFDAANTADIETGQLAAKRGSSKEVREFGAMLARDHEMVRQKGRDLASKLGVTPTPPADDASAKAHAEAMAMLRTKKGADFDRAFLQHEAAFHKAVIDAVTSTLLPAIDNAELKDLVVKVAPAFQAHMIAAQDLEKKLAGESGR
jgi:putative membrane protein